MSDQPPRTYAAINRDAVWRVATLAVAVGALIVALVAPGTSGSNDIKTVATSSVATSSAVTEFDIELGDFFVKPSSIDVPAGTIITLRVSNIGNIPHDLVVSDAQGTEMLDSGSSQTITVGPFDTSVEALCSVPGHKEAGMTMSINVIGAVAASSNGGGTNANSGGTVDDSAVIDPTAFPAADWEGRDPVLPPAAAGKVHEVTFEATETVMEVAPGVKQEMWTFNDQVPGPVLRGKVGDTFRITLVNKGAVGHSIDFHASMVAWDDEMRTLKTGESLVYEFTAQFAGAFMYHCGTAPALHHIGNGMYGVIIIDPPDLAPVVKEFVVMQSELYLGPDGKPGNLTKMLNDDWDAVVFNGYYNQYKFNPIEVEA
ncbi:MAG: multicopper oxidase domain-containing protein, partial [Ilumatobacteraceae bacterium]